MRPHTQRTPRTTKQGAGMVRHSSGPLTQNTQLQPVQSKHVPTPVRTFIFKTATTAFLPIPPHRRRPTHGRRTAPTTRLAAAGPVFDPSASAASSFLALAPEAQMVFEPKLDGGALASFLICATVVLLFWARVAVAVTDRLKR